MTNNLYIYRADGRSGVVRAESPEDAGRELLVTASDVRIYERRFGWRGVRLAWPRDTIEDLDELSLSPCGFAREGEAS